MSSLSRAALALLELKNLAKPTSKVGQATIELLVDTIKAELLVPRCPICKRRLDCTTHG